VDTNALRELVREYEWIHLALGMLGNLLFFVDSVLFLFETVKVLDVWAFVVGSLLMLVRSVGNVLAREVRGDS
jgi:membrane-bound ClpP family serine protease